MSRSFKTKSNHVPPIPFDIDGEAFIFRPHKLASLATQIVHIDPKDPQAGDKQAFILFTWFGQGLDPDHEPRGKKHPGHVEQVEGCQACRIEEKLQDPADDLDMDVLRQIIDYVMEEVGKLPPSSSTG
jgi:hypothetical protein